MKHDSINHYCPFCKKHTRCFIYSNGLISCNRCGNVIEKEGKRTKIYS
jgi:ribosomal protein S27E